MLNLSIFKSLRWRLQVWHALILFVAVAGFGAVLFLQVRKARYEEIDGELVAAARTLDGALRAVPRPALAEGFSALPRPEFPPPRRGVGGEAEGVPPRRDLPPRQAPNDIGDDDRPPPDAPFRGEGPPGGQQPPRMLSPPQFERMLTLPHSLVDRYAEGHDSPYFIIWAGNGVVLKSDALPSDPPPLTPVRMRGGRDYDVRQRGPFREVILQGPERTQILVGRPIRGDMSSLAHLFWQVVVTGLGIFAVGLAGGWWLSRSAVKPIESMSGTAASISASNLHQRIDVAGVDTELAALGQVLNAMFDRLESAFQQQMRFTADASHELRTPLTVMLTNSELALNRARSPEEYRETLETCLRAAQRMKILVDDLLVLARADAGKLELRREPVDLKQVADECTSLLTPLAEDKRIELSVQGVPGIVTGDPDRLAQVITNLLSNAITHTPPQGRVSATTLLNNGHVELTIEDTGKGIPAGELAHLFERFYRVDKARSSAQGGTGLGLSICKTIVEAHGGTVEIVSQIDHGTKVIVRLPVSLQRESVRMLSDTLQG